MTDAEIYRKAAEVIRANGWWDGGNFELPEGAPWPRCALNALMTPGTARGNYLADVAAKRVGVDWLPEWNDAPGRTAEQVIALFEGLAFDEDLKAAATPESTLLEGNLHYSSGEIYTSTPAEYGQEAILPTLKEAVPAR